jgi:hypothetical protein
VRLEIWPKVFHLWATYHQVLAQGRQAVTRAGRLLREGVEAAAGARDDRLQGAIRVPVCRS